MDIKEIQNKKSTSSLRHPWELARIEIIIRMLKQITKEINTSNISVIDIGCGDLFVLEKISETFQFNEYFGVDVAFTDDTIKALESKYFNRQTIITKDLTKVNVNKSNISIVLLLDVIEHIENDRKFLHDLSKYSFVNENTIFIFTVPSFQSVFCSHDEFLVHFRRYSNSQLIKTLKEANYRITSSGYFFTSLLLLRLIEVSKEKLFKSLDSKPLEGTGLTDWDSNKLATYMIKYILLTDFFIAMFFLKFRIKIPGLSNFAICKRII